MSRMDRHDALTRVKAYRHDHAGRKWKRSIDSLLGINKEDKRVLQLKDFLKKSYSLTYSSFLAFIKVKYPEDLNLYTRAALSVEDIPVKEIFDALLAVEVTAPTLKFAPNLSKHDEADLDSYPSPLVDARPAANADTQLTLGDLHGNFLKLMYFLIREKVITGVYEKDYDWLVEFYKKPADEMSAAEISIFKSILEKTRVATPPVALVRLIGDVLCDRGSNDAATLLIIKRLRELTIPLEIIASNHDVEFMRAYRAPTKDIAGFEFGRRSLVHEDQDRSMMNLETTIKNNPGLGDEIHEIVIHDYLPSVKLLNYVLGSEEKSISIYTHAPVGLETIEGLARYFEVDYKARTPRELATTIDSINQKLNEYGGIEKTYIGFFKLHEMSRILEKRTKLLAKICQKFEVEFDGESIKGMDESITRLNEKLERLEVDQSSVLNEALNKLDDYVIRLADLQIELGVNLAEILNTKLNELRDDPLYRIIWNRDYTLLNRPAYLPAEDGESYECYFVHGHDDSVFFADPHIIGMDDELGKNFAATTNHKG
ncbi:MAG TPA: hypothetical protein VD770_04730, partial [Coxiellaceae bacterium]|nr:hypothetical protein [Coxiellaceae bacterium]